MKKDSPNSPKPYEPSEAELYLEKSLQDSSDTVGTQDVLAAQTALHSVITEALSGDNESSKETSAYVELLVERFSSNYAGLISSIEDQDEQLEYGTDLFNGILDEFDNLACEYTGDVIIADVDDNRMTEEFMQAIIENYDENGYDSVYDGLDNLFKSYISDVTETLLTRAPENTNDLNREKAEARKEKAINALKEAGKIALGAVATGLAVRHIGRDGRSRR